MTKSPEAAVTEGTQILAWKRVLLGFGAFIALGAVGAWAAGRLDPTGTVSLRSVITAVRPGFLAVALALVILDYVMGGLRLHVWVRRLASGTPWSVSLRTYVVNIFAAAISPMGSASGPAQVAVLYRYGLHPARAVAALLLNFMAVLASFLLVGGAAGLYLTAGADLAGTLGGVIRALLFTAAGAALLLALIVGNPGLGSALAGRLAARGRRGETRRHRLMAAAGHGLERGVADYRAALDTLRAGWHRPLAAASLLSTLMLLNKCAVGYVLALGMGFEGGYVELAARQSLQWLLIYFSPSPGGSGIAEATVPAFLAGIVPAGRMVEYALLWRFFTAFVGAVVGAVVAITLFSGQRRAAGHAHL